MQLFNRILSLSVICIFVLAVLYIAFYFIFLELIVDYWWFESLDYKNYFWLRLLYKYIIFGGVTLFFFSIIFFHFWIASKFLGVERHSPERLQIETKTYQNLLLKFQRLAMEIYAPVSLILSIILALPIYKHWEDALLYLFAPEIGKDDPLYGHDVSFYMFDFPIYQLLQQRLLSIAVILFVLVALLYWIQHRMLEQDEQEYPIGAKIHLGILAGFVCFFIVWGFILDRIGLLFSEKHEPVFYGPGFIEVHYQLPLIWLSIVTFLLAAFSLGRLFYSRGNIWHKRSILFSVLFFVVFALRVDSFVPMLIETVIVNPNPVKTEKPFMQFNINATLAAYDLENVKTVEFVPTLAPLDDLLNWEGSKHLDNVPLWDRRLLQDVYFQLQGLRPYYDFITVDEDRYMIDGELKQVNLSARELNIKRLPKEAQNWENRHLRYTHGYGAVMTPAAQTGDRPQKWYLRDLNLGSKVGFQIKFPDIYYGLENYPYAIVPNQLDVEAIAGGQLKSSPQYTGKRGVSIKSLFRKMLFAFYFKDEKIFFSVNINDSSRVRFRRNIIERINKLAPFLKMDNDPYLVVEKEAFFWVQDAYTTSDWYPYSKRTMGKFRSTGNNGHSRFNYIRNSVKIVVNAYDGTINFYIADPKDPIIKAYNRAYPGFFKPLGELSPYLIGHLRYPRDIYYEQMKIYARYHQTKPEMFYQQAETWEFPTVGSKQLKPYYLTTEFLNCAGMSRFVQLVLMTPIGRDNLSAFAAADILNPDDCGYEYHPGITLFKIRKDIQLSGPIQIDALIDQDPFVSEQLSLWDQHGSEVIRGRMILLPVGNTVLYLQPVYLVSTSTKIPELARVITASGSEVAMEMSASGAFRQLKISLGAEPEPVAKPKPKPKPKPEKMIWVEVFKPAPMIWDIQPEIEEPIKFMIAGDVSFAYGRAEINPSAEKTLGEIANEIRRFLNQDIVVLINGHTDSKGNKAYNQRLSQRRAEAVKQWLVEQKGIPSEILVARGYGDESPVESNTLPDGSDNPSGRAKNRRVEIIIENDVRNREP